MAERGGRSRTWLLRDLPATIWLILAVLMGLGHVAVPQSRWLLFHLLLLGAAGHSILVWSRHFSDALLHLRVSDRQRRAEAIRLAGYNAATAGVLIGVPAGLTPLVIGSATVVAIAVLAHAVALYRRLRGGLGARFAVTVRYYLTAAGLLPFGITAGVLLQHGLPDPWQSRVRLAHWSINLFGWVGITVLGTLITLWPTIIRTRVADGAVRTARRSLCLAVAGLGLVVAAALTEPRAAGLGLAVYLAGWAGPIRDGVTQARHKRPSSFAGWSVAAGVGWLSGLLVVLAIGLAIAGPAERSVLLDRVTAGLAVGFLAQVLGGALAYLVPTALGGGPAAVRRNLAVFDRWAGARLAIVNLGLAVCLLPVPATVRIACSALVLGALAGTLALLLVTVATARRPVPAGAAPARTGGPRLSPGLAAGAGAIVVAVVAGVITTPVTNFAGSDAAAGATPSGHTTEVEITAAGMRFTPNAITAPRGDRLLLHVRNTDAEHAHDLVLDTGTSTGRLAPGAAATIEIAVLGTSVQGWCSIVGHRQRGMTLHISVAGDPPVAAQPADRPAPGFEPFDARLPAADPAPVHRITLTVTEQAAEIAPGVRQQRWTYDGGVPGPTLRGRIGDRFEITVVNHGDMDHSIDFHAGQRAPDQVMRTIPPGQSLTYVFVARHAGIWLYHCSTDPMTAHIAAGMFGAVIVDPPDLAPVDREYLVVDSEAFVTGQDLPVDATKAAADRPDLFLFNGYAFGYDHRPLPAKVGERVRIWVLAAGPNQGVGFHVVGAQFDTAYADGGYLVRPGADGSAVLPLASGQGGFVELSFAEPGRYPFVDHRMFAAEHGAHGIIDVTG